MHSVTVATFDLVNGRRMRVSSEKEQSYPGGEEREHALTVTHEALNGLARCGYALEKYLLERGVTLSWRL